MKKMHFSTRPMQTLHIRWQRLVNAKNQTCDRCGMTETAVEEAAEKLMRCLKELDIAVVLEKEAIDESAFLEKPLESNRVWISGKPLEAWLEASSGQSRCCLACGDEECRTVTVDGKTYEAIPTGLIVKAGLLAAAQLIRA